MLCRSGVATDTHLRRGLCVYSCCCSPPTSSYSSAAAAPCCRHVRPHTEIQPASQFPPAAAAAALVLVQKDSEQAQDEASDGAGLFARRLVPNLKVFSLLKKVSVKLKIYQLSYNPLVCCFCLCVFFSINTKTPLLSTHMTKWMTSTKAKMVPGPSLPEL